MVQASKMVEKTELQGQGAESRGLGGELPRLFLF